MFSLKDLEDSFCKFGIMRRFNIHTIVHRSGGILAPDVNESYLSSFTEFSPFCSELFYLSNFKDFNTHTQA